MSECRDRLGLWGTAAVDSEVAGNISGLERLRLSRFNKVSALKPIILQYSIFTVDRVRPGPSLGIFVLFFVRKYDGNG